MENKPNYYAIIPADVRYDNRLCANAKLLFGEITALSSKTGECWASNGYFEALYDVSERTVRTWLEQLEDADYIIRSYTYKENSKEVEKRGIKINTTWGKNLPQPGAKNYPSPGAKNCLDNNINNINNINNNKDIAPIETTTEIIDYLNLKT